MDVTQETAVAAEMAATDGGQSEVPASGAERRTILSYACVMIVVLSFTSPSVGLFVIPISFVLKNSLHLSANALATFTLAAGIPAYFAFAFGVARDRWSPLGLGDRGYFTLFGAISSLLYIGFCFVRVSEPVLLANAFLE